MTEELETGKICSLIIPEQDKNKPEYSTEVRRLSEWDGKTVIIDTLLPSMHPVVAREGKMMHCPESWLHLEYEWPTDKGIWMGYIEGVDWMPMLTDELKDDLPSQERMRLEKEDPENAPPRKTLLIVAQMPQAGNNWPYTFQGCHLAKRWRRPDEDELKKAKVFYGISEEDKKPA